jgi:hypothetical protein
MADSDKDKENAGRVMITLMEKVEPDSCLAFSKTLKAQRCRGFPASFSGVMTAQKHVIAWKAGWLPKKTQ